MEALELVMCMQEGGKEW